jgi:DNA processing protein
MGTHRLIKEGAKLVEHVNDVIEELNIGQQRVTVEPNKPAAIPLSQTEKIVLSELSPYPIHIDKLARQVSLSAGEVSSLLLQLELKGLVTQSPGKLFSRSESI